MNADGFSFLDDLRRDGLVTDDEYTLVRKETHTRGTGLWQNLLGTDLLNEDEVLQRVAAQLGTPFVDLKALLWDPAFTETVPVKIAYHYQVIPLETSHGQVTLAVANPLDLPLLDEIQTVLGKRIEARLAGRKEIRAALKRFYGIGADTVDQMISKNDDRQGETRETDEESTDNLSDEASIIKFVNQFIVEAVKERATDIHIEPYEHELKIRYRIDGILYDAPFPTTIKHFHSSIVSRIKIMANLNISEKRLPQDGRFKLKINQKELDLRVSILPTPWGEATSIRLLAGASQFLELRDLGFEDRDLHKINKALSHPHGIILVTGPTGSGKTTSLYAYLNRINSRDRKIITIEDPIEYLIPNITQLQVNPRIQFTFAMGLRSMLRHDPDIMMVGEIRDRETAEIAIQVAMTGHLVFSTLHTNDAPSSITRLLDIGVEHFLVASSLQCVIAQRLVRLLCPDCRKDEVIPDEVRQTISGWPEQVTRLWKPNGCKRCNFTGYWGRTAIYEMILLDQELREMIQTRASTSDIRKAAIRKGMVPMLENGYLKVYDGTTSLDEVLRVTTDNL